MGVWPALAEPGLAACRWRESAACEKLQKRLLTAERATPSSLRETADTQESMMSATSV